MSPFIEAWLFTFLFYSSTAYLLSLPLSVPCSPSIPLSVPCSSSIPLSLSIKLPEYSNILIIGTLVGVVVSRNLKESKQGQFLNLNIQLTRMMSGMHLGYRKSTEQIHIDELNVKYF